MFQILLCSILKQCNLARANTSNYDHIDEFLSKCAMSDPAFSAIAQYCSLASYTSQFLYCC